VRDLLLGREPHDLDIVTAARPEAVTALFERTVAIGQEFGVVAIVLDGHPYQVATFRREGPYLDGRRPSYVEYADALVPAADRALAWIESRAQNGAAQTTKVTRQHQ